MDKRIDLALKRAWDSAVANLKSALATTCVAKNLEFWLSPLLADLQSWSPRAELVDSFPNQCECGQSFRPWQIWQGGPFGLSLGVGDAAFKSRLLSLPISGDLLFGP